MPIDNLTIRAANKNDLDELSQLASQTFIEAFGHLFDKKQLAVRIKESRSVEYFESVFNDDYILLALVGTEIAGYTQFGRIRSEFPDVSQDDRELSKLYVKSDYQRQGIGKALLSSALMHPELAGAKNIYLDVWSQNINAQKLYERFNFSVFKELPWYRDGKFISTEYIMVRSQN